MKMSFIVLVLTSAMFYGGYLVPRQQLSDCEKEKLALENNKKMVADFYQELFGDKNIESINKYMGDVYIQHNPYVADGKQALIDACKQWFKDAPKEKIDIQHLAADGNLVFIHTRSHEGAKIFSVIDIFRIENGKIVEHWDVGQAVPEKAANSHPMF
ncbi:MAG TPA: ester cyclase [Candidatus Acidoferrales bacterium]|nr:ester cyclase [Candidatus Acidoferrales bacterium]